MHLFNNYTILSYHRSIDKSIVVARVALYRACMSVIILSMRKTAANHIYRKMISVLCLILFLSLCAASDLPPQWSRHTNPQGKPYYFNAQTKQTTWEKPLQQNTPVPTNKRTPYNPVSTSSPQAQQSSTKFQAAPIAQQPQHMPQYAHSIETVNREKEKLQHEITYLRTKLNEVNLMKDSFRNSTQAKDRAIESLNEEVCRIRVITICV